VRVQSPKGSQPENEVIYMVDPKLVKERSVPVSNGADKNDLSRSDGILKQMKKEKNNKYTDLQ